MTEPKGQCHNCGHDLDDAIPYCPACGISSVQRRCDNCGHALEDTLDYCPACGFDLPKEAERVLCTECFATMTKEDLEASGGIPVCAECRRARMSRERKDHEREAETRVLRESIERGDIESLRKNQRFSVEQGFVRIRKDGLAARLLGGDNRQTVPLLDLSTGGLQCYVDGAFAKDDAVVLEILLPVFENPLLLKGAVRWHREENSHGRVGIRFDQTDPETARYLAALERYPVLRSATSSMEDAIRHKSRFLKPKDADSA